MATSAEIGKEGTLQIGEHFVPDRGKGSRQIGWAGLIAYILLAIGGVCMITPFFWMILTSVKPPPELVNFSFFPENPTLQNYLNVLTTSSFERWYLNSIIVAVITTVSVVFFDSLVGYTLNKFDFPGKNIIFIGMLGTLMIPTEMLIIPWFTMSVEWNWHIGYAQYWGIAFPGVITAAGIFLMRQFYDGVPNELLDAARMDGMNEFGIWLRIAAPLVKPAMAALAIFNFIGNWNAYLWPLILANSREFYTLPVGLSFFRGESTTHWEKIMTAASLASIPLLIIFLVFQRQIIRGIALTGLKG